MAAARSEDAEGGRTKGAVENAAPVKICAGKYLHQVFRSLWPKEFFGHSEKRAPTIHAVERAVPSVEDECAARSSKNAARRKAGYARATGAANS